MDFVTLTKDMVWKMLQAERKLDAFTQNGAIISLLFDKLEDKQKGKREYSRIWNWTWNKLRYNWPQIDSISELLLHKTQQPNNNPAENPNIKPYEPETKVDNPPNNPLTTHNYTKTNTILKNYNKLTTESVTLDAREIPDESPSSNPVSLWQKVFPSEPLIQPFHQDLLRTTCTDLEMLEFTLNDWKAQSYQAANITGIISRYKKHIKEYGTASTNDGSTRSSGAIQGPRNGTGSALPERVRKGKGTSNRHPKRPGESSEIEYLIECGWTAEQIASLSKDAEASGNVSPGQLGNG